MPQTPIKIIIADAGPEDLNANLGADATAGAAQNPPAAGEVKEGTGVPPEADSPGKGDGGNDKEWEGDSEGAQEASSDKAQEDAKSEPGEGGEGAGHVSGGEDDGDAAAKDDGATSGDGSTKGDEGAGDEEDANKEKVDDETAANNGGAEEDAGGDGDTAVDGGAEEDADAEEVDTANSMSAAKPPGFPDFGPYIEFRYTQQSYCYQYDPNEKIETGEGGAPPKLEVKGGSMNWDGKRNVGGVMMDETGNWGWGHWFTR